jgi:hypothetical protein
MRAAISRVGITISTRIEHATRGRACACSRSSIGVVNAAIRSPSSACIPSTSRPAAIAIPASGCSDRRAAASVSVALRTISASAAALSIVMLQMSP